jgi:hypothetical protein
VRRRRRAPSDGPSWWQRSVPEVRKGLREILVGVIIIVVAAVIVAWLLGRGGGHDESPSTSSRPHAAVFTIEDAVNGGVWTLRAPNAVKLEPRSRRPANAVDWLPTGTPVTVVCAEPGTTYPVIIDGRHELWLWWAYTSSHAWIAMAAFHQTEADGSQGLSVC